MAESIKSKFNKLFNKNNKKASTDYTETRTRILYGPPEIKRNTDVKNNSASKEYPMMFLYGGPPIYQNETKDKAKKRLNPNKNAVKNNQLNLDNTDDYPNNYAENTEVRSNQFKKTEEE